MVEIETIDDIADEIADELEIYNEEDSERSFFVGNLAVRMRDAVKNEKLLYKNDRIIGRRSDEEIRAKIEVYGEVAKESFNCEYTEAMASIHMLKWVLGESEDATGEG